MTFELQEPVTLRLSSSSIPQKFNIEPFPALRINRAHVLLRPVRLDLAEPQTFDVLDPARGHLRRSDRRLYAVAVIAVLWWGCAVLLWWWCAISVLLGRGRAVLRLSVASTILRRGAAVASAVHGLWREVSSSYVAGCRRLARGSRRVASAARLLSLSAQSLFARGQLSRYGFRAAVVDYERSLSSLRAARAAVRQKARGAELAQGDTLASTLSAAAAKIQPTGRVTGCIPTQEYTCSTKNRRVQ